MKMNPVVTDLSHWNGAIDFDKVKAAGILGVINKATQGTSIVDKTYAARRKAAVKTGLLWGAYHFADASDVNKQVAHFLRTAAPDFNTLLALDWEPNRGNTMSLDQAKEFCRLVFEKTGQRPVIYSGNLIKEVLGDRPDPFLSTHRLWIPQYGPKLRLPPGFDKHWLWQYTGDGVGSEPHIVPGISSKVCDLNVFGGNDLAAEWAAGTVAPTAAPARVDVAAVTKIAKVAAGSQTVRMQLAAPFVLLFGYLSDGLQQAFDFIMGLVATLPGLGNDIEGALGTAQQFSTWLNLPFAKISLGIVFTFSAFTIYRHVRDKLHWGTP